MIFDSNVVVIELGITKINCALQSRKKARAE